MAEEVNGTQLQSDAMTPKKTVSFEVWYCRHCLAERPIKGQKPTRCWNYKCRRADWDRPKIKEGRPRKDQKRKPRPSPKAAKKGKR